MSFESGMTNKDPRLTNTALAPTFNPRFANSESARTVESEGNATMIPDASWPTGAGKPLTGYIPVLCPGQVSQGS